MTMNLKKKRRRSAERHWTSNRKHFFNFVPFHLDQVAVCKSLLPQLSRRVKETAVHYCSGGVYTDDSLQGKSYSL